MPDLRRLLDGVRLVDLTTQLPGPFCSMMLADLGADVVKVEAPGGDPARVYPALFAAVNRGKRSIALDLKRPAARGVLRRLVETADLMLEGFRPGVAARLGADYDTLSAINPGLIYCSISGFGQTGPDRDRAGHDVNYLALAGVLGLEERLAGRPTPPPVLISDLAAGQYAAIGLLAALAARRAGAPGQFIDLSMADGAVAWTTTELARLSAEGRVPDRPNVTVAPHYDVFRCADGKFVSLGIVYEDHFWRNCCDVLGLGEWRDLGNAERLARRAEISERLGGVFSTAARDEWSARFAATDVPFAPVLDLPEVIEHKQFLHRQIFSGNGGVTLPMKFSAADASPRDAAPGLGEHTRAILEDLDYTPEEIAALGASGAA